jgi:hypothetical protein
MSTERNLRRALGADAAVSLAAAVAGVALAGPIGRLLDVPSAAVVVVSAAFVLWVLALAELARADRAALLRFTPWVVAGNGAYVAATGLLLATGVVDPSGWWLLVPAAVVVADLGLAQGLLWRSLGGDRHPAPAGLAAH